MRLQPALWAVLALVALLVGLSTTSAAAPLAKVPKRLVADVERALKLGKSADKRARKALKEAKAARANSGPGSQGPQGLTGATGTQGERGLPGSPGKPGSGLGYAQIEYCAAAPCEDFNSTGWFSSDDTNSPGIDNTVNFQTNPAPPAGVFCYRALPFTAHVVMAGIGTVEDATGVSVPYLVSGRAGSAEHPLTECPFPDGVDPATTAAVFVRGTSGALVDPAHDLRIWVLFG